MMYRLRQYDVFRCAQSDVCPSYAVEARIISEAASSGEADIIC